MKGKEEETDENDGNHVVKEEEVEVRPEETSGKPKEELFGTGGKTEEDPHKVHEYREWLDSKDEVESSAKPQTKTKVVNGKFGIFTVR